MDSNIGVLILGAPDTGAKVFRTPPNFRHSSQHRKAKDVLADELTEDLDTRKDFQVQGPKAKSELLVKRGETATW